DENDLVFGAIRPKLDSESADNTIEIIGLDLPFRRYERVSGYKDLFTAYMDIKNASDPIEKQQKIRAVEGLLGANNKYAAFARAFARYKRLDSRFGVRIPVGAEV
nr:hypothetical protein [Planctomycetota bacterium]